MICAPNYANTAKAMYPDEQHIENLKGNYVSGAIDYIQFCLEMDALFKGERPSTAMAPYVPADDPLATPAPKRSFFYRLFNWFRGQPISDFPEGYHYSGSVTQDLPRGWEQP